MAEEIKVLIAESDFSEIEKVKEFLSLEPRINVIGQCSDGQTMVKLVLDLKPDVVVADMDLPGVSGISATQIVTTAIPGILVVITASQKGKNNIKKAMAAGARKYLQRPYSAQMINSIIVSIFDKHKKYASLTHDNDKPREVGIPEVITVFSTKGGVGKTTIAVNTAVEIIKRTNEKVLLLDFDFRFGDISLLLNLFPKRTIFELIGEIQNLDSELLEDYLIEHPSGIKVLPAPLGPQFADYIDSESLEKILATAQENYKYIIIDTASTFEETTILALDAATRVLFVTTTDLHTIKNVKVGLEFLKSHEFEENKLNLLLNRYHAQFGLNYIDLGKTIGKNIVHVILEDNVSVAKSINTGSPFVLTKGKSKAAKGIKAIVDSIVGPKEEKRVGLKKILPW